MKSISVTQVLGLYQNFDIVEPHIMEQAIERGNDVHRYAAMHANRILILKTDKYLKVGLYIDSFRKWFDKYVEQVIFIEERFFDRTFFYDGKPDLGVELIDKRRVIVDIKTAAAEGKTWKGQVAAYCELAQKKYPPEFDGGMSLRLKKDGKEAVAKFYEHKRENFAAFISALTAYRYFK